MAVAVGYVTFEEQQTPMHPFFRTALNKDEESASKSSAALDVVSIGDTDHDDGRSGSIRSSDEHVNMNPLSATASPSYHRSGELLRQGRLVDAQEHTEDFDIDLNSERRKRRKTSPPEITDESSARHSLHAQLEDAAQGSSVPVTNDPPHSDAVEETSDISHHNNSPKALALRKSPRRAPQNLLSAATGTNKNGPGKSPRSQGKLGLSPSLGVTPKKKVLKLNANGKLLSSPQSGNPVPSNGWKASGSRKLTGGGSTAAPSHQLRINYGTDGESKTRIGRLIDGILSQQNHAGQAVLPTEAIAPKAAHPFFSGKLLTKPQPAISVISHDASTSGQESEAENTYGLQSKKPTDWKDLVFTAKKTSISSSLAGAVPPIWPPKDLQHLGAIPREPETGLAKKMQLLHHQGKSKARRAFCLVSENEDLLRTFAACMREDHFKGLAGTVLPERILMSGQEMMTKLGGESVHFIDTNLTNSRLQFSGVANRLRAKLASRLTAFDVGTQDNGQSWLSRYAPIRATDVLQPDCESLRDWLAGHRVQNTKMKTSEYGKPGAALAAGRRKRRRKKSVDLDDFIVTSGEEDLSDSIPGRNAVLLSGPSGCGKTASVFAVARELDFEVFEIHPGMRRSAKDIFDKVGDMTQNHLVQKAAQLDHERAGSTEGEVSESSRSQGMESGGATMKKFLGSNKRPPKDSMLPNRSQDMGNPQVGKSQLRKQSLILFEEVDILFEEDKAFWSGVLTLIEQSKRPVVMTCNDQSSIPFDELPLHSIFTHEPPSTELAVDYILALAANEGHWLERSAVSSLYHLRGMDFRATIVELDFWCQMAVGSEKAGLDWMIDRGLPGGDVNLEGEKLRVFSRDTYTEGLGLVPCSLAAEKRTAQLALLRYARDELQIPVQYWHEDQNDLEATQPAGDAGTGVPKLLALRHAENLADSRSILDLFDDGICDDVGAAITSALTPQRAPIDTADVVSAYLKLKEQHDSLEPADILRAFEPVMTEKPTFPPSIGRLAPSFDGPLSSVVTDIAPFVRTIVAFDQRLEQQRDELAGGSQRTKIRKTRAARAALEGGSKANTRSERWFPTGTSFAEVLRTGGDWPLRNPDLQQRITIESREEGSNKTDTAESSPSQNGHMDDNA